MFVKTATWAMGIVATVIVGAPAQAETFKDKSGTGMFQQVSVEDTKLPDGTLRRTEAFVGWWATDLPAPWDYISQRCNGTVTIGNDGKVVVSRGHCEASSMKGDRAAFWYSGSPAEGGRWGWISGNGAFAGINGGGTYKPKAVLPGVGLVIDWTGSWQTDGATAAK